MSAFIIDFSSAGLRKGLLKGLASLGKTMAATGIAYLGLRLDNLHVASYVKPEYAVYAVTVIGMLHAAMTTAYHWLTTTEVQAAPTVLGDGSLIPA